MKSGLILAMGWAAFVAILVSTTVRAAPPPDIPVTGGGALWTFTSPSDGTEFRIRNNVGIDMAAPVTTQFDDRTFTYFGAWNEYLAPSPDTTKFGPGDHWTDTTLSAGFIFSGTQVKFYGSKSPWLGIASFSLDGGTAIEIDLYQAANADQQLVWDSGSLTPGIHRVIVKNTGRKNLSATLTRVSLDRADVIGGKIIAPLVP